MAVYQFVGQYVSQWGLIFSIVLAMLPVLIVFFLVQRYVIKGFASDLEG